MIPVVGSAKRSSVSCGDVAQLGERSVRNAEVEGSNPFISTKLNQLLRAPYTGMAPFVFGNLVTNSSLRLTNFDLAVFKIIGADADP